MKLEEEMNFYHGTDAKSAEAILENGFKITEGIFGAGVYFSSSTEGASIFGSVLLQSTIDTSQLDQIIWRAEYNDSLAAQHFKLSKDTIIYYENGEKELFIKDITLIKKTTHKREEEKNHVL